MLIIWAITLYNLHMKKQLALGAGALLLSSLTIAQKNKETQQPNILLFIADDCTYRDLACYGSTDAVTPTIDNFAKEGMQFSPITNEVIKPVEITTLKSLTEFDEPAIKYFAGTAQYSISFDAPTSFITNKDSVYLNIGKIDATAEVRLNGQLLAYAWTPYTKLSVSKLLKKNNKLEISVAVVCRNRFIGDYNEFGNVQSLWTTSTINI